MNRRRANRTFRALRSSPCWVAGYARQASAYAMIRFSVMATEPLASFAERLPRLHELKDMTDQSHPDAYFQDFESRFVKSRTVLAHYQRLENRFAGLDDDAWSDLRDRAAAVAHIRENGRGWEALFDVLNEATGYEYLKHVGCLDIRFVPRRQTRTPD